MKDLFALVELTSHATTSRKPEVRQYCIWQGEWVHAKHPHNGNATWIPKDDLAGEYWHVHDVEIWRRAKFFVEDAEGGLLGFWDTWDEVQEFFAFYLRATDITVIYNDPPLVGATV